MSSDSHLVSFQYKEPINPGTIRVLEFVDRNAEDAGLKLRIRTTALPRSRSAGLADPYCTLSYCWGPVQPAEQISLDDAVFTVGPNLFKALVFLEKRIKTPIWIDAVCINQGDKQEKDGQVDQMGDVYRNSQKTVIWLGDGDTSTNRMMQHLKVLGETAFNSRLSILDQSDIRDWPLFRNSSSGTSERKKAVRVEVERIISDIEARRTAFDRQDLAVLIDLTYRDWFSRVWVIQELCLSEAFEFACGEEVVSGDFFIAGLQLCTLWTSGKINDFGQSPWYGELFYNPSSVLRMLRQMSGERALLSARASTTLGTRKKFRVAQKQGKLTEQFTLKHNLVRAFTPINGGSLNATMAKDRVYGLLGISSDAEVLDISSKKTSLCTHEELFTLVARELLQRGHIDLLSYCGSSSPSDRNATLPSWVPDWTKPLASPWESSAEDGLFKASDGEPRVANSRLPEQTGQPIQREHPVQGEQPEQEELRAINLEAYHVGKVVVFFDFTAMPDGSPKDPASRNRSLMTSVDFMLAESGDRYTEKGRKEGRWRIPIADREFNDLGQIVRATEKSKREYEQIYQAYESILGRFTSFGKNISYFGHLADAANRILIMLHNKFIGLAPAGTRQDDEVWIPSGAHVPYVFRRTDSGQYSLLGSVFVHGLMDGEIFKLEPPVTSQVISLV